jgi:hypothetical protein
MNVNNIKDYLSLNPYKMEDEGGEGGGGVIKLMPKKI